MSEGLGGALQNNMGQASCKVACEKYAEHLEQTGQLCHQRPRESTDRWYQSADVDPDGCRRFPALPEPGRHPRLLFTEAEIPFLLARYTSCDGIGELLGKNLAFGERKLVNSHTHIRMLCGDIYLPLLS